MTNKPIVKISERSVKSVRSYRPQDLSVLDRLTCKTIEVLTYGQQTYSTVKISERSVKAVRSYRPQDLSVFDRLTCKTIEV